ncbi:MAG: hypothetical protein P4N41_11350 [Negativicutes bacterium]|nr:hypothetical protein [Negativicutes bacterium]
MVIILYVIMMYDFYTAKLLDKVTFYLRVLWSAPPSAGQAAYIGMIVLAVLFFLWSTGIVVLCAVELVQRVKEKRAGKKP